MICNQKSRKRWNEKKLLILAVWRLMNAVSEAMLEWTKGDSPKLGEQGGRWVTDITKIRKNFREVRLLLY